MNVLQSNKFIKRQTANNRTGGRANTIFKQGYQNPRIGIVANTTPRYSFDGVLSSSISGNNTANTSMGPPQLPIRIGKKSGQRELDSISSKDVSGQYRGLWTPKYGGPQCSSTSRAGFDKDSMKSVEIAVRSKLNSGNAAEWILNVTKVTMRSFNDKVIGQLQACHEESNIEDSSTIFVFPGPMSGSRSRTTPCSTTSNTTIADSCIILAISEGRGAARGEVGMAAVDLRRPYLELCQLSDSHSYLHSLTKIHYFHPVEIIVPHTFNQGVVPTELYRLLKDNFPSVRLTSVQRKNFSDANGLQQIQHLCAPEYSSVELQLMHKFYALTAAAAVLKYVEYIQCVIFAPHSLKIEYHGSQNSTLIDVDTAIRLELVESLSGASERGSSLISILNYTNTAGGLRALRADLLQPPCDLTRIAARLACVEELLNNQDGLMPALQSVMRQLYDVDKVLWLCMQLPTQDGNRAGEAQLNHTLQLQATAALIPALVTALSIAKGQWFSRVKQDLEDPKFTEISLRISRVLHDNLSPSRTATAHLQRCFSVKPGINGLLDVARRSYCELVSDAQTRVEQLAEEHTLPLKLGGGTRGLRIQMSGKRIKECISNLHPIFLEVHVSGNTVSMTTEEIVILDQQARESLSEIQTMSNIVIFGLLTELRPYMGILYKLCEHVAELDVLLSLAQVSSAAYYVKPTFNEYLELKESVHPMLDYLISTSPVANDVFSSPEYNFHIITGPNMGGKSIFIKQIALLQIMAQIGCFVPASSAVFRITDHIFSRIGFNDSIECNASTYVLEMKEIHYILQTITPTSLVIVDELCRGTSCEEGTSMAWAICERLLNTEAFTFFTTHFLYLTRLQDSYPNVVNLHTDAEEMADPNRENAKRLIYKHKILPGVTTIEHYGLTLARNTNMPQSVVSLADDLAEIIAKHKKPLPATDQAKSVDFTIYKLAADLRQECRRSDATDEKLNEMIEKFKEMHPNIMRIILAKKINSKNTSSAETSEKDENSSGNRVKATSVTASRKRSIQTSQENPLTPLHEMCLTEAGNSAYGEASFIKKPDLHDRSQVAINDSNFSSIGNSTSFIENSYNVGDKRLERKVVLSNNNESVTCAIMNFNSISKYVPYHSQPAPLFDEKCSQKNDIMTSQHSQRIMTPESFTFHNETAPKIREISNLTGRLDNKMLEITESQEKQSENQLHRTSTLQEPLVHILDLPKNASQKILADENDSFKSGFRKYASFTSRESDSAMSFSDAKSCQSAESHKSSPSGDVVIGDLSEFEIFIDNISKSSDAENES